jgi:hypothetical protein
MPMMTKPMKTTVMIGKSVDVTEGATAKRSSVVVEFDNEVADIVAFLKLWTAPSSRAGTGRAM